jgi:DNA phosphorothioation-associated putative methyltransferase
MTISTMHLSHADVAGHMPHGDGFISRRQTFQKYFTQPELLDWVGDVLGERPISLGQAVVAVFKDKDLEQQVAFERRSKASIITSLLKIARAPKQCPLVQLQLSARIADEIDAIWQAALSCGRVPTLQELNYEVSSSLAGKRVSFARALQACAEKYDFGALADVATARREDLIVNGALSLFPGAPKYGSLPASMQRDIRQFFGSSTAFRDVCLNALGALRDRGNLQEAFANAVASGVATTDGLVLRFSTSQEARLPTALRIMVGCAEFVRPGFTQVDAVEIGPKPSQLKGYVCNDFSLTLPKIVEILEIDLGRSKSRTVRKDDSILYLKSRFMANDDHGRTRQEIVDGRLVSAGVVTESGFGPKGIELSVLLKNSSTKTRR